MNISRIKAYDSTPSNFDAFTMFGAPSRTIQVIFEESSSKKLRYSVMIDLTFSAVEAPLISTTPNRIFRIEKSTPKRWPVRLKKDDKLFNSS